MTQSFSFCTKNSDPLGEGAVLWMWCVDPNDLDENQDLIRIWFATGEENGDLVGVPERNMAWG
jgi:hypothetical protein